MPAITDLPIWTSKGYEIRTQDVVDTTPVTYTYSGSMQSYIFRNDGSVNLTLTIGGTAITVASGEIVTGGVFSSFQVQASSGSVSWTMRAYGESSTFSGTSPSSNMSALLTFQSGATGIGDGTVVGVSGYNSMVATLTSTGSATIAFEYSMDNVLWVSLPGQLVQNTSSNMALNTSLTVTSTVFIRFNIVGLKYVRFRISAYTSGTIGASAVASTGSVQYLLGTTQAFGNVDTNAVNNTLLGVGAYNLLYDGTNWVRQRAISATDNVTVGLAANAQYVYDSPSLQWNRTRSANGAADGSTGTNIGAQSQMGYNGATWDRVRVGKVYKYIEYLNLANATATTVWTPTTSKKFRLMGITVQSTVANNVHLRDGAGGTIFSTLRFTTSELHLDINFGNGYLSSAANNVLEIYNATGSTSSFWVTAWGTEE